LASGDRWNALPYGEGGLSDCQQMFRQQFQLCYRMHISYSIVF
jgi:hypothetical protein